MHTPPKPQSVILACALTLCTAPIAFAGGDHHFKMMDADGDGKISRAEHAAASQQMFTQCDANHDGVVTAVEMDAATAARGEEPGKHDKTAAQKIQVIDQNGDGQLTAAEHKVGSDKMFTMMDKDGDGFLSKDECDEGQKMMKKDK